MKNKKEKQRHAYASRMKSTRRGVGEHTPLLTREVNRPVPSGGSPENSRTHESRTKLARDFFCRMVLTRSKRKRIEATRIVVEDDSDYCTSPTSPCRHAGDTTEEEPLFSPMPPLAEPCFSPTPHPDEDGWPPMPPLEEMPHTRGQAWPRAHSVDDEIEILFIEKPNTVLQTMQSMNKTNA